MGVIYVDGSYKSSSNISKIHKLNELQDNRLERIENILDGSDGSVDNPDILNALIQDNTSKITTNIVDIQSLKTRMETVEQSINKNTITINGITVSLNSIDQKIDTLNSKIDNLSGLSWVEVLNINN